MLTLLSELGIAPPLTATCRRVVVKDERVEMFAFDGSIAAANVTSTDDMLVCTQIIISISAI